MRASFAVSPSRHLERVLALRSFPGLSRVDPAHLTSLSEITRERTFVAGTPLFLPGEPLRSMYLVRRGRVAVLVGDTPVRHYGPGDIVGAVAALTQDPGGRHAVAEEETQTFELDRREFMDVVEDHFSLLQAVLSGLLRTTLTARLALPGDAGFPDTAETIRPTAELGLVERVLFVRRLLMYGHSHVEALAELAREMTRVKLQKGDVLWEPGDPAPHALLVWSGAIRCTTPQGHSFRFGTDSAVGALDSIAGEPRWYRAVVEADGVALRSNASHLFDVLEDHPDMGIQMLRSAASVLTEVNARLERATLSERTPRME